MEKDFVITVGRQFGSGGREIGKRLAAMMGIAFYDRTLISEAVGRSGLSREFFEREDEKLPGKWKQAFSMGLGLGFAPGFGSDNLFRIQSEVIRELASRGPCVIVGRCADYILRDMPRRFDVFINAPMARRAACAAERLGISEKEAAEKLGHIDKSRAAYYNFYTNKHWGDSTSYNLCIDSSVLGLDGSAEAIRRFVEEALATGAPDRCRE